MASILIALSGRQESVMIKNLLVQNGFGEIIICSSGARALLEADQLEGGIVICGYKLVDMIYSQLREDLPKEFAMLLLASDRVLSECTEDNLVSLSMPFRAHDLVNTVELMLGSIVTAGKKKNKGPTKRTPEEEELIRKAKALLMNRNNMSERDAHRYIQKCSMDASISFVEMAQMVLAMR
ncbi:MAG: ANTAR domain-containing protein [Lachnospiraceae bacterium]|nr:ANTAR domain-containing protein [Lachnospiraceae bacterium]